MKEVLEKLKQKRTSPLEEFSNELTQRFEVSLYIKRDDLIHPFITGNKWRKLKYNLIEAINQKKSTLLTFGGAYSNHIYATAAAGAEFNFNTIGVIRGESPNVLSPTLQFAKDCGMTLHFVSRESYLNKTSEKFIDHLASIFGDFYLIPEGGSNGLSLLGTKEICDEIDIPYQYICTSVGTGGTIAGISCSTNAQVLGFSSLKGGAFLEEEVKQLLFQANLADPKNREWMLDYHGGGYGKFNTQLIDFIKSFPLPLDPVYTGKMMYGLIDLIKNRYFPPSSSIIFYHSGGLQGRNF